MRSSHAAHDGRTFSPHHPAYRQREGKQFELDHSDNRKVDSSLRVSSIAIALQLSSAAIKFLFVFLHCVTVTFRKIIDI